MQCCACAILSSVTYRALQYISTLSHRRHDFLKKVLKHTMCISIFSTTFVSNILILRRTKRDMIINACWYQSKVPTILAIFNSFSRQIFGKYSYNKFHENPSSGSWVVPWGRTDMKLIVTFANFKNGSQNKIHYLSMYWN